MAESLRASDERVKSLVGFFLGDVRYAVDIFQVREVISPLPLVSLPQEHPAVVGVADHRGEVVTVVDLRRRLGLPAPSTSRSTKWIVVTAGDRGVALIVDKVTGVFGTAAAEPRSADALGLSKSPCSVTSVWRHEGHLVFVLDIDHVAHLDLPLESEVFAQLSRAAAIDERADG